LQSGAYNKAVIHRANARFWRCYHALPEEVQRLADRCFTLLKVDARHKSLHFKKVHAFHSVRVGLHYRALGIDAEDQDIVWFWIGSHAEYDALLGRPPARTRRTRHEHKVAPTTRRRPR
jgi:hypothetical protein